MDSLSSVLFALIPPGQGGEGPSMGSQLGLIAVIIGIFYMLIIRPQNQQRKQHDVMLQNLKKGDKIVTSGGLHGTVSGVIDKDTLKVRIADQVSVQISRSAVATKRGEETE